MKKNYFNQQLYESPVIKIIETIASECIGGSTVVSSDKIETWGEGNNEWFK